MKILFNGELQEAADGATVSDLLRQLDLVPQRVAVEVNLQLVPRGSHDTFVLRDGDRLEVVTLVGGG